MRAMLALHKLCSCPLLLQSSCHRVMVTVRLILLSLPSLSLLEPLVFCDPGRIISRLFVSYLSKGKGKSARQDILQVIARVLDFDTEDRLTCRIDGPAAAGGGGGGSGYGSGGSRRSPAPSPAKSPGRCRSRSSRRGSPAPTRRYQNPVDSELY